MKTLRTWLMTAVLMATGIAPAAAQFENVGSLDFPTSATGEAQSHFLRGMAILHSFGWKQAREQFQAAQAIDPDFAMAYWAESLAYDHPLVSQMDPTEPRRALERLAPTPEERQAKAPTPREKGFLAAVEVLWGEGDHISRRIDYMMEMEGLYRLYPQDPEVAAFYALSMLSAAAAVRSGDVPAPAPMPMPMPMPAGAEDQAGPAEHDMSAMAAEAPRRRPLGSGETLAERLSVRAGAIAQRLAIANPNHPGAPHYMIHAFDDPLHAPLALDAAYRFSEIAPAVAHARHMPTHIFIQLGMWELVSLNNQSAYDAAKDLWEPGDNMGDAIHPLDWGQYGDLQLGDYEKAQRWIDRLEVMANQGGFWGRRERGPVGAPRAVNTLELAKARLIVESERWIVQPVTAESSPSQLLATALSAYHLGDAESLGQAEAALSGRTGSANEIMHLEVSALLHASMGHADVATGFMDRAQAADEALPPPRGAASPIKPVHELYGELLLDLDRPAEAVEKFETSLLRLPNRARSLLGIGRAYVARGTPMMAGDAYEQIAEMWAGREELPGMLEAREFWRMHLTGRAHGGMSLMDYGRLGM
jgi:tetratricopeptide (TPR) repeat protein